MANFINPYNFVRYDPTLIQRQRQVSINTQEKLGSNSGRLTCYIIARSRVFIPHPGQRDRFCRNGSGDLIIPGSSLKGELRAVAEAISSACFSALSDKYSYKIAGGRPIRYTSHLNSLDFNIRTEGCKLDVQAKKGLCVCCRIFGSSPHAEGEEGFAGKVEFSDAKAIGYFQNNNLIKNISNLTQTAYIRQHALSSPKPHHEKFYLTQVGSQTKLRGRKFYYHRGEDNSILTNPQSGNDIRIEPVKVGAVFEFTVNYKNLSNAELGLLLLSLELQDFTTNNREVIYHKIGHGKPLGLGSAEIKSIKIEKFSINRYKGEVAQPITDEAQIRQWCEGFVDALKNDHDHFYQDGWNDLKSILDWNFGMNRPPSYQIRYPHRSNFFSNPFTCSTTGCRYNGRLPICEHPLPTAQEVRNNTYWLHD